MKSYPPIPGPHSYLGQECIGFDKLDGSNLRFEWSKKKGFYKFGTRNRLFDQTDPEFGSAIPLFQQKYSEPLSKIIPQTFKGIESFIVFCEFYGPNSFAGMHHPQDQKDVVLLDVNLYKKGFIVPELFVELFQPIGIPRILYQGPVTQELIQDVRQGKYPVQEGLVLKGKLPGQTATHSYWMAKVKTQQWLQNLKQKAQYASQFTATLNDNLKEQNETDSAESNH